MSIMGMREWFRKNRVIMGVILLLILVGLLISYGLFGRNAAGSYSAADYQELVAQAREAYEADPTDPETVYALAQALANYTQYLSDNGADQDEINAADDETVKYYDEYFGLMVDESIATYEQDNSYSNAYMVAQYLNNRASVQSMMTDGDSASLLSEANSWMLTAMNHRIDDDNADLAENPNNADTLADLADATAALAYYQNAVDESVDLKPGYLQAVQLYLQAIENSDSDTDKSEYYQKAAAYAYNADDLTASEQYYSAALELTPDDYDANTGMAAFLLNAERYDEASELLKSYQATLSEDDDNYATLTSYIDYINTQKEAAENPTSDDESDTTANN